MKGFIKRFLFCIFSISMIFCVSEAGAELTSIPSQFATSARTGKVVRKLKHIGGQKLPALINNLRNELDNTGTSYYFAK